MMNITITEAAIDWFKRTVSRPRKRRSLFGKIYGKTQIHDGFQ